MRLFTCRWLPIEREIKALIFLCHGYGMECSLYTRETGVRLAREGFAVFGIDYEGHGKSQGVRCYIPSFEDLVTDCDRFFLSISDRKEYADKPRFLYGESMGGAVATLVSRRNPSRWNGLILIAPMCKISENMRPSSMAIKVLSKLAGVAPKLKVVPSKDLFDHAFKDPIKRAEIRANPYAYRSLPRLRTALELFRASTAIERTLHEVSLPFLCLHGKEDVVTDPEVSQALFAASMSSDKTLNMYPGMWHGLTTGEPDHNVELVFADIKEWLSKRVSKKVLSPQLHSKSIISVSQDFKD